MEYCRGSMSTNNHPSGGLVLSVLEGQRESMQSSKFQEALGSSGKVQYSWDSKNGSWRVQEVPGWIMRVQVDQENLKSSRGSGRIQKFCQDQV